MFDSWVIFEKNFVCLFFTQNKKIIILLVNNKQNASSNEKFNVIIVGFIMDPPMEHDAYQRLFFYIQHSIIEKKWNNIPLITIIIMVIITEKCQKQNWLFALYIQFNLWISPIVFVCFEINDTWNFFNKKEKFNIFFYIVHHSNISKIILTTKKKFHTWQRQISCTTWLLFGNLIQINYFSFLYSLGSKNHQIVQKHTHTQELFNHNHHHHWIFELCIGLLYFDTLICHIHTHP